MKRRAGYFLIILSVLIALFALVTTLNDVIGATRTEPTDTAPAGLNTVGIVINLLGCGAIAFVMYRWGRALVNPSQFSAAALVEKRLRSVYQTEGLARRAFSPVPDELNYAGHSDAELDSVYRSINRQLVPDRFQALLAVVKARVEKVPPQEDSQPILQPPQDVS